MGGEGFIFGLAMLVAWGLIGLFVAYFIKLIWKRETLPGWPILWIAFLGAFGSLVLAASRSGVVPPEREYRGPQFCLEERRWDDVIAFSREFAAKRGLSFGGGRYEGAGLNIGLSKGDSLFRGPEIALDVFSDPVDRQKTYFFATTREKLTPADARLAKQFEAGLLEFACS